MKLLTAYILVAIMYFFVGLMIAGVFWWMNKNRTQVYISQQKEGVNMADTIRGRFVKDKFYTMVDFFKRKPKPFDKEKLKDYLTITEGLPFIGINLSLEMNYDGENYTAWRHNTNVSSIGVNNSKMAWTETTRQELYEATVAEKSKQEQIKEILIPMGLIILAIACLIFFPKIYGVIMEQSTQVASTAVDRFSETINRFIPMG